MKRSSALFLQIALVLVGVAMLTFLLGEPHLEGRNAHATLFEIYFQDPFLAFVYIGSTPFFLALGHAFRLLAQVRRTGAFSQGSVDALRAVKRCALVLLGFVAGAAGLILIHGDGEDRPAGIFMSLLAALGAGSMAATATLLARKLQITLGRPAGGM